MTNKIRILIFILSLSKTIYAQELQALPVTQLAGLIEASNFTFKEHNLLFGFNSLHSCLYVGQDILVLKHYCYPKKTYAAKGYKIISIRYGVIDLYEETFPNGRQKRDIIISSFPAHLEQNLDFSLEKANFSLTNGLVEKLYAKNLPSCWSTNNSFATNQPEVKCRAENVKNFESWAEETQKITHDPSIWNSLLTQINHSLHD